MSGLRKRKGAFEKQIVSANLLLEGDVVYRTHAGEWSLRLGDAAVALTEPEAQVLLAGAQAEPHLVVDAGLVDVRINDRGDVVPLAHRERIKALGPTNRPDLGKQADDLESAAAEAA